MPTNLQLRGSKFKLNSHFHCALAFCIARVIVSTRLGALCV